MHTPKSVLQLSATLPSSNDASTYLSWGSLIQLYLHLILSGDFFCDLSGDRARIWQSKKKRKKVGPLRKERSSWEISAFKAWLSRAGENDQRDEQQKSQWWGTHTHRHMHTHTCCKMYHTVFQMIIWVIASSVGKLTIDAMLNMLICSHSCNNMLCYGNRSWLTCLCVFYLFNTANSNTTEAGEVQTNVKEFKTIKEK